MTARCEKFGLAASTAYDHGCRCAVCLAHSQARSRAARERKKLKEAAAADALVVPLDIDLKALARLADAAFRRDPSYAADILEAYSANKALMRGKQ